MCSASSWYYRQNLSKISSHDHNLTPTKWFVNSSEILKCSIHCFKSVLAGDRDREKTKIWLRLRRGGGSDDSTRKLPRGVKFWRETIWSALFFSSRLSVAPEVAMTRVRFLPRVARRGASRRERGRERETRGFSHV